jgi:AsmA protein
MKLEARIDVTGDIPELQIKQKINKVQLAPLFQDMTGKEDITGTALVEVDISTSGLTWEELRSHTKGTMRLEFLNGEIKPLRILQEIRTARALHRQELPPPMTTKEATEFVRLTGTGTFEDGILYNDDLMAASELMQITGGGEIILADRQLDFKLNVSLAPHLTQDKDMGLTEFDGKIIPYTIVGPFTDLNQAADVAKFLPTETEKQPLQELDKKEAIQKENGADTSPEHKKQKTVGD